MRLSILLGFTVRSASYGCRHAPCHSIDFGQRCLTIWIAPIVPGIFDNEVKLPR